MGFITWVDGKALRANGQIVFILYKWTLKKKNAINLLVWKNMSSCKGLNLSLQEQMENWDVSGSGL